MKTFEIAEEIALFTLAVVCTHLGVCVVQENKLSLTHEQLEASRREVVRRIQEDLNHGRDVW